MDIPSVVITGQGFGFLVDTAFKAIGFAKGPAKVVFPLEMFLPGSGMEEIEGRLSEIAHALTAGQGARGQTAVASQTLAIEGRDYDGALERMHSLFLKNAWSDGLPFLPPTQARVDWLLTGTDFKPDSIIGKVLPKGGLATVRGIGVQLAMAGGRPEYLPVLIAAVQAFTDPVFKHQVINTTTSAVYPAMIVNGPIAKQISLNSGYGCLGPDPAHPAGTSIGRALRLVLMNIGGAVPARGTMSIYGGPARAASIVFAEDEDGLPEAWQPVSVERGFAREANVVTLHAVASSTNIACTEAGDRAQTLNSLHKFALAMGSPNNNSLLSYEDGSPGIVLIARGTAAGIAQHLGFSKMDVKQFLWEHSQIPWPEVERMNYITFAGRTWEAEVRGYAEGRALPITGKSENIILAVAGGEQSGHGYWMQAGPCFGVPVSVEVRLPANWDNLLQRAAEDIG